jgi:hypothetical protein
VRIDDVQERVNLLAGSKIVGRLVAWLRRAIVINDDMIYPFLDSFGYRFTSESIVDEYMSPSRRSIASFSIGTVGSVSLNNPEQDEK